MPARVYTASTNSWVAQATWCQFTGWGGGGPGGGISNSASTATSGGGSGGCCCRTTVFQLAINSTHSVLIGAARTATSNTVNGNQTSFRSTSLVAPGGIGGPKQTTPGAAGSSVTGSTVGAIWTDFCYRGGAGGQAPSSVASGGGGGGAGNAADGGDSTGRSAGLGGVSGGGNGGAGVTSDNTRNNGVLPGGGGSGTRRVSTAGALGGNGAAGRGILYYAPPGFLSCLGVS